MSSFAVMNKTKYTLSALFFVYLSFGYCQEEQNTEANWKLYPNGLSVAFSDSSKKEPILVLDTLSSDTLPAYSGPAFVEVIQDYRIKQLLEKDKFLNQQNDPPQIDGYRIKIYFGSGANSRQDANQTKAKFLQKFPKENVYVNWNTPNYTTTVGDYRTKMDAEKFLKEMSSYFPEGFIVPSKIELPELQ